MRNVRLAVTLTLAALLAVTVPVAASEHDPDFEPIPIPIEDPLLFELISQGVEHPVTEFWRVDDGNTVSVLWQFTTPDRDDVPPVIEIPSAGDYPWYTGSRLDIVNPFAFWTGAAWAANPDGGEILTASDTNPTLDAKKKIVISYWWKRRNGQATPPGPTLGIPTPGVTVVNHQSWPSHLYPGAEFVIVTLEAGPPCPGKVEATLESAWGTVLVTGFLVTGTCPA